MADIFVIQFFCKINLLIIDFKSKELSCYVKLYISTKK